jgi:hypothetical protein
MKFGLSVFIVKLLFDLLLLRYGENLTGFSVQQHNLLICSIQLSIPYAAKGPISDKKKYLTWKGTLQRLGAHGHPRTTQSQTSSINSG